MRNIDNMLLHGGVVVGHPEYYVNLCAHLALLLMAREEDGGWRLTNA